MNRDEFYEAIADFRTNAIVHKAKASYANETQGAGTSNVDRIRKWEKVNYQKAVNLVSSMMVASYNGDSEKAAQYEREFDSLWNQLSNVTDDSALMSLHDKINNAANSKFQIAKKSTSVARHEYSDDNPYAAMLEHGTKWKKHKYIRIENGRYIYPEDDKVKENTKESAAPRQQTKEEAERWQKSQSQDLQNIAKQTAESAAKAQAEGEAQQKWKDEQEAKKKAKEAEYKSDMDKLAELQLEGLITGKNGAGSESYKARLAFLEKYNVSDKNGSEFEKDLIDAVAKLWDQKRNNVDPATRNRIEGILNEAKGLKHTFESNDEYEAAIKAYKERKRSFQ